MLTVLKQELLSKIFLFKTIIFSLCFLLFLTVASNIVVIQNILSQSYGSTTKLYVILQYIGGYLNNLAITNITAILLVSLLFGLNLQLAFERLKSVTKQKNLRFTFGSGLISLGGASCTSCGFSVLSVFGLGGTLAAFPFRGFELLLVSGALLTASLIYNLRSFAKECRLS